MNQPRVQPQQAAGVQLEQEQLEPGPRGRRGHGHHEPARRRRRGRPLQRAEDRLQQKVPLHEVEGEAEPPRRRRGHERRRGFKWVRIRVANDHDGDLIF